MFLKRKEMIQKTLRHYVFLKNNANIFIARKTIIGNIWRINLENVKY